MTTLSLPKPTPSVQPLGIFYDAWVCTQAQQRLGVTLERQKETVPVLWRRAIPLDRSK